MYFRVTVGRKPKTKNQKHWLHSLQGRITSGLKASLLCDPPSVSGSKRTKWIFCLPFPRLSILSHLHTFAIPSGMASLLPFPNCWPKNSCLYFKTYIKFHFIVALSEFNTALCCCNIALRPLWIGHYSPCVPFLSTPTLFYRELWEV